MKPTPYRAPWLATIARIFQSAGMPVYAVGGIVRNTLMGLPSHDVDLCGPARPQQVVAFCNGTAIHAVLRAAHFGTVELHVTDESGRHMAEYTTFRVDSYRCGHQPSAVRFADTLEEDSLRRDFSVNALYHPLLPTTDDDAPLFDPTGGLRHLAQGVLHTVTPDPDQVLKDDGLRILRMVRFQAELGLQPTSALLASAAKYAHLLTQIAHERLRDELTKLLLSDVRYPLLVRSIHPIVAGLTTLHTIGAWAAVFGNMPPSQSAIAAMAHYTPPEGLSPISGKLALLFADQQPAALASQLSLLRYAAKDVQAASEALEATSLIARGSCTLMDAVRMGIVPVSHASHVFAAFQAIGQPCEAELAAAQSLLLRIQDPSVPKSLKELAIHGEALLPLCNELNVPTRHIGHTLDRLWQEVVNQSTPNTAEALLAMARHLLVQP